MNTRIAVHALRRTAHVSVLLALVVAAFAAYRDGTASALADATGVRLESELAGRWIESTWTAFLVLVVPCLVFRAASLRTRGEVGWVSVSRTGIAGSELSRAVGASAAIALVLAVFSVFVALGPTHAGPVHGFVANAKGPDTALVEHGAPLAWSATIDDEADLYASIDVSLSITAGAGGEVRLRASRRVDADADSASTRDASDIASPSTGDDSRSATTSTREGSARVLPRGSVEVEIPRGSGVVEFELSLPELGARGFVTSEHVELWRVVPASAARARVSTRVAIAVLAWALLAFGLGAWLRPWLAVGVVAAYALAIQLADSAPRTFPGARLAQNLAIAADGRAPAPLGALEYFGLALVAFLALHLARRGAEGRP